MTRPGHGPEGTQAQWHEPVNFADFVRRALHAAVEQVEPQADGLEPIRAKIPAGSGQRQPAHRQSAQHQSAGRPAGWRRRPRRLVRRSARRGGPGSGTPRR